MGFQNLRLTRRRIVESHNDNCNSRIAGVSGCHISISPMEHTTTSVSRRNDCNCDHFKKQFEYDRVIAMTLAKRSADGKTACFKAQDTLR
jgi:hypothetical protein